MARLILRRGNSSVTVTGNPILRRGEPGWDADTNALKMGDGTTPWDDLPALGGSGHVSSGTTPPNGTTPGPFYIQIGD